MSEAGRRLVWTRRTTGWLLGVIGLLALGAPAALAAGIPGTARLSGRVTADAPFRAAQVYALNRDRSMLYMVYTADGAYLAPNLVPGAYEVWAEKGGLRSEHRMLRIEAGQSVQVDHALAPGPDFLLTLKDSRKGGPQFGARPAPDAKFVTYDEMYPDEPGRATAEATCMRCHGQGFLPGQKRGREEWVVLINVMLDAPPADERNRPQGWSAARPSASTRARSARCSPITSPATSVPRARHARWRSTRSIRSTSRRSPRRCSSSGCCR